MEFGALWFPWFGFISDGSAPGGTGTYHWDALIVEPEKGHYASNDLDVITWQIGLLREIGADSTILSWWGIWDNDIETRPMGPGRHPLEAMTKRGANPPTKARYADRTSSDLA